MGYSTGGSFWFYARIEISKRFVHNINTNKKKEEEKSMNLINFISTYYILFLDQCNINQTIFFEFE